MEEREEIEGTVEGVTFVSPDKTYTVFRLRNLKDNRRLTVTINAPPPLVGQQVKLFGLYVTHPRFGEQFKASGLVSAAPAGKEGIERFLASGAVDGIGPAMAKRLVNHFGAETLDIMEKAPGRLTEVAGIGKKTAKKIAESYRSIGELREIMIWLETHGISGTFAGRIFEKYSSQALNILEHHPYQLAKEIDGIGFLTADTIAGSLGIAKEDEARIAAGIDYALLQTSLSGHVCVPESYLSQQAAKLLQVPEEKIRPIERGLIAHGELLTEYYAEETLVYAAYLYHAEVKTATKLLSLKRQAKRLAVKDPRTLVAAWEKSMGVKLAQKQREAIAAALTEGVFVLTGGPGTGKTTVIKGMLELLTDQGLTVLLGAPTGRAAKRLAEATGAQAQTVHRLLEAQGGPGGGVFAKNADSPLEADAIILDEVSMMDIVLMRHFLDAVSEGTHVILVGDANQLPSVGPGSVLKDILRSGAVSTLRLTEVFRQDETSTIVLNAHAINAGRLPKCSPKGDFRFYELAEDGEVTDAIVLLCSEILPRAGYSPLTDIQVLSPMHRQECGVTNLNGRLQAALNPPAPEKAEKISGSQIFRLGDKVMQVKNNYVKGVFNGDIGFVSAIEAGKVAVKFGDDLTADYQAGELTELQLAYAMSVHKSQGSEYPAVILPLVPGHYIMLQRNLLYTAVTRAKELVVLLGSKRALTAAVMNDRTRRRYTLLTERLTGRVE